MDLKLQPEEVELLRSILVNYVSNLKTEISNTEKYELREDLKRDEAMIVALIARLDRPSR